MTKLLRLTEITKDGKGTKEQPMLLNSDFIATVTTGKLEAGEIHIVGQTKDQSVTFIAYKNNAGVFVRESLEEIAALVAARSFKISGKN